MNLAIYRANGAFSQRSLSIFGNPKAAREDGNLGMAMLFEPYLLEQIGRVQQPPKMRKISGVSPAGGQKRTEREKLTGSFNTALKNEPLAF
jgi:hypothetical protein